MALPYSDTVLRCLLILLLISFIWTNSCSSFSYDRDYLLKLRPSNGEIPNFALKARNLIDEILAKPEEPGQSNRTHSHRQRPTRRRRRGCRGGALVRLRKRMSRAPLPSIMLANVRSLRNKMDELIGHIDAKRDYRDCNVFSFTETWLDSSTPDTVVSAPGFALFRADRDFENVHKTRGGGVCFMVNEAWCTDTKVISQSCNVELECLTIRCRPYYLPREFSSVLLTVAYIPPKLMPRPLCTSFLTSSRGSRPRIQGL